MVNVTEEIQRLNLWKKSIEEQFFQISKINNSNKPVFYSISSVSTNKKINPYTTPIRLFTNKVIAGAVVGSQIEALIVANYVEKLVTYLLLDVEKKIPIQKIPEEKIFKVFNLNKSLYTKNSKTVSGVEFGNISSAVRKTFSSKKIINYKPNDLTVESVWFFLSNKLKNFANLKIAILGSGNIGFKLALKLVESGAHVNIHRRNKVVGLQLANIINSVKPPNTLANAEFYDDPIRACTLCNVIIGTANTDSLVINESMLEVMVTKGIIIDCGKGNITEKAINYAIELGLEAYRSDVTSGIISFVDQAISIKKIVNEKSGRKLFQGDISIISGGIYGRYEDIIVDDYKNPKIIFGMADGRGKIMKQLTNNQFKKIKLVSDNFKIDLPFFNIV